MYTVNGKYSRGYLIAYMRFYETQGTVDWLNVAGSKLRPLHTDFRE